MCQVNAPQNLGAGHGNMMQKKIRRDHLYLSLLHIKPEITCSFPEPAFLYMTSDLICKKSQEAWLPPEKGDYREEKVEWVLKTVSLLLF